ncbi:(2Fe-2S) ferredoxin domain-containing protein [Nocardiopsis exhalans]|uniref:(2Fe-2S) ferredoxin domain-containing protein n=1 Tax=Nocardiopsis exhalans TaxID=163604 RepID=A0ABY5D9Y1_9ACTN|nr:(2Fe-2S) ferredoxin domain-containing protein [Nocardiopsis exhalans]USY21154.1 (2Fe-2S) ferredoxin domain-containing protein [Nocardiopsis exhalans]
MTARVLVGMSIREANAADELGAAAKAADARLAFLQVADPALSTVLTELADAGAGRIELVGVALGRLAPGHSWLRRVAGHWWRERGTGAPEVVVAARLVGPDVAVPSAVASALETVRPISGTEAPVTSAAWEEVPGYRRHLLVCRGPRCSARGAEETWGALAAGLSQRDLGDDDVLMTATGCMFPCNQAPVVAVQPDDVWYGGIGPGHADEIIDSHLVAGEPVEDTRIR